MGQFFWGLLIYFLPIWLLLFVMIVFMLISYFLKRDYLMTNSEIAPHLFRAFIIITSFSYWFVDITTFSKTVELMIETGMKFTAMYALVKYLSEALSE